MLTYSQISSNYQPDKVLLFSFNDITKSSDTFFLLAKTTNCEMKNIP
mgnify:CR=1 FL=1